jgi:hypothetical protein
VEKVSEGEEVLLEMLSEGEIGRNCFCDSGGVVCEGGEDWAANISAAFS